MNIIMVWCGAAWGKENIFVFRWVGGVSGDINGEFGC